MSSNQENSGAAAGDRRARGLTELAGRVGADTAERVYWLLDQLLPLLSAAVWSPALQAEVNIWLAAAGPIATDLAFGFMNRMEEQRKFDAMMLSFLNRIDTPDAYVCHFIYSRQMNVVIKQKVVKQEMLNPSARKYIMAIETGPLVDFIPKKPVLQHRLAMSS
jgi:hypothetical protein